jgi:hypothetical protein
VTQHPTQSAHRGPPTRPPRVWRGSRRRWRVPARRTDGGAGRSVAVHAPQTAFDVPKKAISPPCTIACRPHPCGLDARQPPTQRDASVTQRDVSVTQRDVSVTQRDVSVTQRDVSIDLPGAPRAAQVRKLVRIRKSETHGLEGIIDDRLEFLLRGDQTARPDYAMLTAGGRVVGHSPVHRAQFPAVRGPPPRRSERETEGETERERTERVRERQRDRDKDRDRERQRDRDKERESERQRERQSQSQTETERERETDRDRERDRETERERERVKERETERE